MTRLRAVGAIVLSALAVVLVWAALAAPDRIDGLGPWVFLRLPVEALALVVLAVLLPPRGRAVLALGTGVLLGLLAVLKVLDMGFYASLNRPFDVVVDWRYAGSVVGLVRDSFGGMTGTVLLVLMTVTLVAVLALVPLATLRLARLAGRHPRPALRVAAALAVVWALLALAGVRTDGAAVASAGTSSYAVGEVGRVRAVLRDQRVFERAAAHDPLVDTPPQSLLTALRGKDVLVVFVESYGRVALEDPTMAPGVGDVLDRGTRTLAASGFGSRSAFLTSPTFGAISWLAHSTLQAGLWVDSQQRYDALLGSRRLTLTAAFGRAGWRTVADVPANTHDWPQSRFYGYDKVYDARNVGYAGPRFGYPTMPDQFTLDAFHRLELAPATRRPVMAEIDLISSHAPWSRTPRMVDDATVGDGSVFHGMPATLPSEGDIWPSPRRVRAAYAHSVEYSLEALVSFVRDHADERTVLVVLGDHQPATIVTGPRAGHDVPVSVIAKDPAVLRRIEAWHWQQGLHPTPDAPVWRMDRFRDRFLSAFAR